MKRFLEFIGYSDQLHDKNKFSYIITGVGLLQILFFLFFYVSQSLQVSQVLILQTVIIFLIYGSSIIFYRKQKFLIGKVIMAMALGIQVFLLIWLWYPEAVYMIMFFFIVPPITFIVFDLEKKADRYALLFINVFVTFLLIMGAILKPYEFLKLNSEHKMLFRMVTILMTYFVQILVFFFYAHRLAVKNKELRILADTDVLTNISNRRVLFETGHKMFDMAKKYDRDFMLMILDIDHFKSINDKYGHPIGDHILKELTQLISMNIRREDLLCRFGGEEFAIILKNINEEQESVIHTIWDIINSHHFYISEEEHINVTFSAGVLSYQKQLKSFEDMVVIADKLLYKAKNDGRNRIIFENGDIIS